MKQAMKRLLPSKVLPERLYATRLHGVVRAGVERAFEREAIERFVHRMYGIVVILGKPKSRGRLGLRSRDVREQARLDPAYYSHPEDMTTMLAAVRLARRISEADGLARWGNRELMPGRRVRSDEALAAWIGKNTITTYHYAGTCRMGDDPRSVVDARLRFRGLAGLRVGDASAIPVTPVSALNAPSMVVGLRAARYALEDARAGRERAAAE
jgi:choline dehydrogenase